MNRKRLLPVSLSALLLLGAVIACIVVLRGRKADYAVETKTGVAMGTIVSMKLYDETAPALSAQAMCLIDTLENTISMRVESSPVAELNRGGACRSDVVAAVVRACAPISEATGGAFDLSVGAVSTLWDFGGENERLPDARALQTALSTVDYTAIHTSGNEVTCADGQMLDLGAVGKGLACDDVKAFLLGAGVKGAVVSVGGSICAFGSRNRAGDPWRVAIRHPRRDDALLGTIMLREGFVSTSGDYEKYFDLDGKRYFHILDARTGYPADTGLCSVTVVCGNGLLSDALSTACFLLGKTDSEALLTQYDAAAVFVSTDGEISTFGDVDFTPYES